MADFLKPFRSHVNHDLQLGYCAGFLFPENHWFAFFHAAVDLLQKPVRQNGAQRRRQHDSPAPFPPVVPAASGQGIHEEPEAHDHKIDAEQLHQKRRIHIRREQQAYAKPAIYHGQKQQSRQPAEKAVLQVQHQLDAGDNGAADQIYPESHPDEPLRKRLPPGEDHHERQGEKSEEQIGDILLLIYCHS